MTRLDDLRVAKCRIGTAPIGERPEKKAPAERAPCTGGRSVDYWQPGYLNDPMRVDQLNEPLVLMYSFVYQKVQSSTGSTVMAL